MLRQKDLPPDEQSELFRIADQMQRAARESEQETKAAADAAEELGVAPEYLERAAAELHARRLERIARNRKRNRWVAAAVVVLAVGGMWTAMRQASVRDTTAPPPAAAATVLDLRNGFLRPGSQGIVGESGGLLRIDRSGDAGRPGRFANVAFPLPAGSPRRLIEVTLRGQGIDAVRADLEAGDMRWKGANERVSTDSRRIVFDTGRMTRQTRRQGRWRNVPWTTPSTATEVVLKFGDTVNPAGTKGEVRIERIELR